MNWRLYPYNDPACRGTGKVGLDTSKGILYGVGEDCPNCWGSGLSYEALYTLSAHQRKQIRDKELTKAQALKYLPIRLR